MDYDQAKAAFFQELNYPEEEMADHIEAVVAIIRSHIDEVYLASTFDSKIQKALDQVIATMDQALEVARALEQPNQEQKYKTWKEQIAAVQSQVHTSFTHADIQLPILSGGEEKKKALFKNQTGA